MTESAILSELTGLFEDLFDEPVVLTHETTASDVAGWDSTRMIEIIVAVESHFGIKLTTREIDGLARVGDLVAVIADKTNTQGKANAPGKTTIPGETAEGG